MKKYIRNGFTIIELMMTIAIMAIVITVTVPSSLNPQTISINYANVALQQAKSYTNMINDNYTQYYTLASKGLLSIPYSAVVSNGYNEASSPTDIYGASPCATVSYNSSMKKLNMFMYYSSGKHPENKVVATASNYLHGVAGQLSGSVYIGAFNGWNIPSSQVIGSCGMPQNGSMAINLKLLTIQVSQMQDDTSLHRVADISGAAPGTGTNSNTLQTDLIMSYKTTAGNIVNHNGLYLTESNGRNTPYITTGANSKLASPYNTGKKSDIVVAGGGLVINSFQAILGVAVKTACSPDELGKIVHDATAQSSNIPVSNLVCTYDVPECGGYCYVPVNKIAIRYTNQTSSSFSCPNGSFVDLSNPPLIVPIIPNNATKDINNNSLPDNCIWVSMGLVSLNQVVDANGKITNITATSNWMSGAGNGACSDSKVYTIPAMIKEATCTGVFTGSSAPTPAPTPNPL